LTGAAVSLFLLQLPLVRVQATSSSHDAVWITALLEQMLRLPEGIILMWPLFFGIQRLLGRTQGLTLMEWLWVFAWVGTAVLAGAGAWNRWAGIPADVLQGVVRSACLLWYVILIPSMALLALVIALLSVVSRVPPPWTHYFGVVLVIWPVLPLAGILALAKFAGVAVDVRAVLLPTP
jgi:hypothetical protein